jgi:ribonuclease VapC
VIVVDTSALVAIILTEPGFEICRAVLEAEAELLISAGTVAEALIVAGRRNRIREMTTLIEGLGFTIVPVSAVDARRVAEAYEYWGKGVHPAGLNFGDCFAYALAKEHGCPLLYVGEDFARTDLAAARAA